MPNSTLTIRNAETSKVIATDKDWGMHDHTYLTFRAISVIRG